MKPTQTFYFSDARLRMGEVGRFLVRFISFSGYGIGIAGTIALLLSDVPQLNGFGYLAALFFGERLLHYGQAERRFVRIPKGRVNIADYIAPASFGILESALRRASVFSGHFFLLVFQQLLLRKDIRAAVARMDIIPDELAVKIDEWIKKKPVAPLREDGLTAQLEMLVRGAFAVALRNESFDIAPRDLFAALGGIDDAELKNLFDLFSVGAGDFENAAIFSRFYRAFARLRSVPATLTGLAHGPYNVRHRVMNRAWTARPTPMLDAYSEDLTDLARLEHVGFLVGHKNEYEQMVDVLSRPTHPNVLLIGEPGVGKSSMVAHLAFEMAKDRVPAPLFDKRLV